MRPRLAAVRPPLRASAALLLPAAWLLLHATSPAVRGWRRPERRPLPSGPLHAAAASPVSEGPVVVLLHGITASGSSFGADYDDLGVPAIAVDLLGFGRSFLVEADAYDRQAHVEAVVATLSGLGVDRWPLVLVGHSMGAVLALHVAAAVPAPVGVVALSAPLYLGEEEGLERIGDADPLARLLAVGGLAERACRWMCEHRRAAGLLWPVLAPAYPVPVASDGVLHTWLAYRGSLTSLVLDSDYESALAALARREVPVRLIEGARDGVPVPGRGRGLAERYALVAHEVVDDADHALPLSHARWCAGEIRAQVAAWT